jgi:hypothetical protein
VNADSDISELRQHIFDKLFAPPFVDFGHRQVILFISVFTHMAVFTMVYPCPCIQMGFKELFILLEFIKQLIFPERVEFALTVDFWLVDKFKGWNFDFVFRVLSHVSQVNLLSRLDPFKSILLFDRCENWIFDGEFAFDIRRNGLREIIEPCLYFLVMLCDFLLDLIAPLIFHFSKCCSFYWDFGQWMLWVCFCEHKEVLSINELTPALQNAEASIMA